MRQKGGGAPKEALIGRRDSIKEKREGFGERTREGGGKKTNPPLRTNYLSRTAEPYHDWQSLGKIVLTILENHKVQAGFDCFASQNSWGGGGGGCRLEKRGKPGRAGMVIQGPPPS